MKRPHIAIYPLGFFALLVASLPLAQGSIPSMGITKAGKNESESVTISPENPTASWSTTLAPGFTATYSVQIEESGEANGTNYSLKSGPTGTFSSPENTIWTPEEAAMNATYSILNTAKIDALATMRVDVVWEPERGEGGEGEGGSGPDDIHGWAKANVDLRKTHVHWHFDREYQWANGQKLVQTWVFASDGHGQGVTSWALSNVKATEASPESPGWNFSTPVQGSSAWIRTCQFASSTPSKGKVEATLTIAPGNERKYDSTEKSAEEIAFFVVELITPAGDPVNSPKSSGDGQNEFSFSTASPGVLTMNIKAKVEPSGVAASIVGDSIFEVGEIEGSTMEWAAGNEDGEPTASGDDIVATVTFTNLPASNGAFGAKVAKYHYDGEELLIQEYEVFFPKTADNHPELGPYLGPRPPNWYYYWSQTFANNSNTTMIYDGPGRSTYDFFDNHRIKIRNDASLTQIAAWGTPRGIDTFAWTTAHEAKHHTQLTGFWPNGWIAAEDDDIDWLPNNQETNYMPGRAYDKSNAATFPDTIGYGTDPIPDVEDICMRSQTAPYNLDQLWNNGDADDVDWANPGKNSETSY